MRISLFVHSLGTNPIARAKPLADALVNLGHDVEVLGLLYNTGKVYAPYRDCYRYLTLPTSGTTQDVLAKSWKLSRMATGDLAYSFKPLLTSFLPGLFYSGFGKRKPLFLDVEDDEVFARSVAISDGIRANLRDLRQGVGYWPSLLLDRYVRNCAGVTVSSAKLGFIYGGKVVLHGPKMSGSVCEVGSKQQRLLRKRFDLPIDKILLLFAGKPVLHKGFQALLEAVSAPVFRKFFHLALAGPSDQGLFESVKVAAGSCCSVLGMIPHSEIHDLVQAADLVPVLQVQEPFAESQIPAKLLEAMACGRASVVTKVGDLPELVGAEAATKRGWVIADSKGETFIEFLEEFSRNIRVAQDELRLRGNAARSFHDEHSSTEAIAEQLGEFPLLALNETD